MQYQSVSAPPVHNLSTPLLLKSITHNMEEVTCYTGTGRGHTTLGRGSTTHNIHNEIHVNKTKACNNVNEYHLTVDIIWS
jgi:hypothetical protein